jgi:2-polyprenyl-3-methyl-5-hydroxy-6-metoxy-1,4-benzoquinol methylase
MIRSVDCPACFICRKDGVPLHHALKDRLFGTDGEWNLKRCSDPACGLVWLDPMPLEADIHKAYETFTTHVDVQRRETLKRIIWNAVKNGYLQYRYGYRHGVGSRFLRLLAPLALLHPGGRAELDALSHYLPSPAPDERLLEIGCGNGQTLTRLSELGWQAEGVDVDPVSVGIARSHGLKVSLGNLKEVGFAKNSFDAILMNHVFEHIHEPLTFLKECSRILKPHGKLVMITPNADSWGHHKFKGDWYPLDPPRHIYIYTLASMRNIVVQSRFEPQTCISTARGAGCYPVLSRCLQRFNKADPHYTGNKSERIYGLFYRLIERFLLLFKPDSGEELLIIARNAKADAAVN